VCSGRKEAEAERQEFQDYWKLLIDKKSSLSSPLLLFTLYPLSTSSIQLANFIKPPTLKMDQLPPPRISLLVYSPSPSSFIPVLSQLLEPSPPLSSLLAPQLHSHLSSLPSKPTSYKQLLDLCQELVDEWDVLNQASFVASHPRIGEQTGLSTASESEQGKTSGKEPTSGHVLRRLTVSLSLPLRSGHSVHSETSS